MPSPTVSVDIDDGSTVTLELLSALLQSAHLRPQNLNALKATVSAWRTGSPFACDVQ
jgi:hypothetical protein